MSNKVPNDSLIPYILGLPIDLVGRKCDRVKGL